MSIQRLRLLDIVEKDEEALVQEVLNSKIADAPMTDDIFRGDIPDIRTPEEEAKWQKIIDARKAKKTPREVKLPSVKKAPPEDKGSTSEGKTTQPGQDIPPAGNAEGAGSTPETNKSTNTTDKPTKAFCDFCDSKRGFHKRTCPTRDVDSK